MGGNLPLVEVDDTHNGMPLLPMGCSVAFSWDPIGRPGKVSMRRALHSSLYGSDVCLSLWQVQDTVPGTRYLVYNMPANHVKGHILTRFSFRREGT